MKGLSALSQFATRSVIKQFADKHHLVYFGSVNVHSDDHQLVRGVTASATHSDRHYTVGTFNGRDVLLVERHNTVTYPGQPTAKHHWLILQLDLARKGLPHVFIDSHHGETFHSNVRVGHSRLRDITSLLPKLAHKRILAPVENLDDIHALVTSDFVAAMHSFAHFDFEVNDDQVFVYALNPVINNTLLTDMMRVGCWLADYLDAAN